MNSLRGFIHEYSYDSFLESPCKWRQEESGVLSSVQTRLFYSCSVYVCGLGRGGVYLSLKSLFVLAADNILELLFFPLPSFECR